MKCYACNNIVDENDEVCSKCGTKVIRYSSSKKKNIIKDDYYFSNNYYSLAVSFLITKFISYLVAIIFPMNLVIPWTLLSLVFAIVDYVKFKDKREIKIIIIDSIIIIIEIMLLIFLFTAIINWIKIPLEFI